MFMDTPPERRRDNHPRIPFRVAATVWLAGSSEAAPLALTENLSRGGLGMRLFEASEVGAEVTVDLHLFNRPSLLRAGRIVWVKRHAVPPGAWLAGVAFHNELAPAIVNQLAAEGSPA